MLPAASLLNSVSVELVYEGVKFCLKVLNVFHSLYMFLVSLNLLLSYGSVPVAGGLVFLNCLNRFDFGVRRAKVKVT